MKGKIILKLWLIIVMLVFISLLVVGILLNNIIGNFYFRIQVQQMMEQGKKIEKIMKETNSPEELSYQLEIISDFIEGHVMVSDQHGMIGACNSEMPMQPGMHLQGNEIKEVLNGNIIVRKGRKFGFEHSMLMVALPVQEKGKVLGAIMLFKPVQPITATVNLFRKMIIFTAIGAIILTTIFSFFISRTMVKPIIKMNEVAKRVAAGDFKGKVHVGTSDEIGNLARTFNYMSQELERYIGALSNEKSRLANILKSLNDGVISFNYKGEVIQANPQAEKILGVDLKKESLIKKTFWKKISLIIEEAFEKNVSVEKEIKVNHKYIGLNAVPLKSEVKTRGVVLVLHDITSKKKAEQLRREFLSNVAHELRTPLSLLKGYAEAIADGMAANEKEQREYLKIMCDEVTRLNRIVNDLSDLNAMEAGHLTLNKSKFYLGDAIKSVAKKFKPAAEEKNIELKYHLPAGSFPLFYGDQERIEQILINLVSNAVNYTPAGGKVIISLENKDKNFIIEVKDTGEGIPLEEIPRVWERFYRVDKARSRKTGGSGLGLAIVKNLVEAHGGRVRVSSQPGKGSIFTVILPMHSYFH